MLPMDELIFWNYCHRRRCQVCWVCFSIPGSATCEVGYAKRTLLLDPSIKFGQLILGKISDIAATRCQILRLKCTKFDFGWGSAPDPTGGAYCAPQTP